MVVFQPPVLSHGILTYDKAAGNHCLDNLKVLDHDLDGNLHLDLDGNLHLDLDGNLHLDLDGNLHLLHNECALNDEVSTGRDPLVAEFDGGLACARKKATQ